MKSIVEIFLENEKKNPNKICIVDDLGEHSYHEVYVFMKKVLSFFNEKKYDRGSRVLVECDQNYRFLGLNFACDLFGLVFVPLENGCVENRIMEIVVDTKPCLIVSNRNLELDTKVVSYAEVEFVKEYLDDEAVHILSSKIKLSEVGQILYTTGTTGKSKGIEITHKNNIALAENIFYGVRMKQENVEWIPLPVSHSHGLRSLYADIFSGGTVLLSNGLADIGKIYDMLKKYDVTGMDLSPSAASMLLFLSRGRFSEFAKQLTYIQLGTAILSEDVKVGLKKEFIGVPIYNCYGSTESGRSCLYECSREEKERKFCIGKPSRNASFIVVDENREIISSSENHLGFLACKGAMNMKGYYRNSELTAEVTEDGYIYSNDEGYIDDEGYIYVLGRRGDIINFGGIKISPTEIEEIVIRHPNVVDCACGSKKDRISGEAPFLYLQLEDETIFSEQEFREFILENIDANKRPTAWKIVSSIPRTYNGKIQRAKIRDGKW